MLQDQPLLSLGQLRGLRDMATEYAAMGDDYVTMRLKPTSPVPAKPSFAQAPFRIDGVAWLLCLSGAMNLEVNLERYRLTPGTLFMPHPRSIIQLQEPEQALEGVENFECLVLLVSDAFMHDTNIDLNVLSSIRAGRMAGDAPLVRLDEKDAEIVRRYFTMLHDNASRNSDPALCRAIARNLVAALCYQALQIHMEQCSQAGPEAAQLRPSNYVRDFMTLVRDNHRSQRQVKFYASRLFITPRYLSTLVKNATGRSASEWIDQFVVLEAKSLLRFSGLSVSQIAVELNFPNQSTFGKYFKHLTGMTPTQYQRS